MTEKHLRLDTHIHGWKTDLKEVRKNWQVEIRKSFDRGGQLLVIVGLDGYNYGMSDTIESTRPGYRWHKTTRGYNVRMSSNSAVDMTWDDWKELNGLVQYAKEILENVKEVKSG